MRASQKLIAGVAALLVVASCGRSADEASAPGTAAEKVSVKPPAGVPIGVRGPGGKVTQVTAAAVEDEPAAVKATFDAYKAALLAGEGAKAVELLDSATFAYYARAKELALTASAAAVKALPVGDRLMVLMLRTRLPLDDLRRMSPRQLLRHAVDEGWIGKASMARNAIGTPTVSGDLASAPLVAGGKQQAASFTFRKEEGRWKLDLTSLFPLTNQAITELARQKGMTEDAFVLKAIEAVSGKAVTDAVWDAPAPAP